MNKVVALLNAEVIDTGINKKVKSQQANYYDEHYSKIIGKVCELKTNPNSFGFDVAHIMKNMKKEGYAVLTYNDNVYAVKIEDCISYDEYKKNFMENI
jgi:hypothetical protein